MRRDALLACLEAAKEVHSKLWARTSVEIAFEASFPLLLPPSFASAAGR